MLFYKFINIFNIIKMVRDMVPGGYFEQMNPDKTCYVSVGVCL